MQPCRSAGPGEATGNDLVAEIAAKMEVGGTGDIGTTLTAGRAGRCRTPRLDGTGKGRGGLSHPPAGTTGPRAAGGSKGARSAPSPDPNVRTLGRLAMTPNGCHSQPPCLLICRPSVSLHRPELRRRPPGSSPAPALSFRCPSALDPRPAPDVRPCSRSRPHPFCGGRSDRSREAGSGSAVVTGRRFRRFPVPPVPRREAADGVIRQGRPPSRSSAAAAARTDPTGHRPPRPCSGRRERAPPR